MKMHRALYAALSLLVTIGAGAVWWVGTPAYAAGTWLSTVVPIQGTVNGPPESVVFSGQARVSSRLAPDPDFNAPRLMLTIDLSGVSGVGSSTRAKYVISGTETVQRRLAFSHLVEIMFPFSKSNTAGASSERSGVASFMLSFDLNTGAVTTATAAVATPNLR